MNRPPLPPFTAEAASQKARLAEDAWNTRDPAKVALAYSVDSVWRNRAEFIHGREVWSAGCYGPFQTQSHNGTVFAER
jgi:uncharacterized protein